jgi:O-antigen ligase
MRLGEYKDAFRLIQQYPWFGVGYGSAPNVDLYIGVSSIYLLIAENDGLIGLAIWLIAMGSIAWRGIRATLSGLAASRLWAPRDLTRAAAATEVASYVVSCLGALASILVAGLFDHHFVDIQFPHVVALVWLIAGLLMVGVRLSPGLAYNGGVAEVEADSDAHRDLGLRTRRSAASM